MADLLSVVVRCVVCFLVVMAPVMMCVRLAWFLLLAGCASRGTKLAIEKMIASIRKYVLNLL